MRVGRHGDNPSPGSPFARHPLPQEERGKLGPVTMKSLARLGLVVAGYLVALGIASAVVALRVVATNGPDRRTYGTMFAFGDSLLFLAVFAIAAIPATGAALFFLRPYPRFWRFWSIAASVIAATALAAAIDYFLERAAGPAVARNGWAGYAVLRIFAAPLFGLLFLVSGLFAPRRSARFVLLAACIVEAAAFISVVVTWVHPFGGR